MTDDAIEKLRALSDRLIDPDTAVQILEFGHPDAMLLVTHDGLIAWVNRHFELMFGYHRSELYDQPVELLLPEEKRERHRKHRYSFSMDPRTRPMGLGMILQGRRKDGVEFDVEISLAPMMTRQGYFTVATIRKRRENAPGPA